MEILLSLAIAQSELVFFATAKMLFLVVRYFQYFPYLSSDLQHFVPSLNCDQKCQGYIFASRCYSGDNAGTPVHGYSPQREINERWNPSGKKQLTERSPALLSS